MEDGLAIKSRGQKNYMSNIKRELNVNSSFLYSINDKALRYSIIYVAYFTQQTLWYIII